MPRAVLIVSLVAAIGGAGCAKLAEGLGAPDRSLASIAVHVPDSLWTGDTAQISADARSADGRPAWTDTVITWRTSDAAVLSLDASSPPTPAPHGFSRIIARAIGQVTLTAQAGQITVAKVVTVIGPASIATGDNRLGYALANQASPAGPYSPAAPNAFNSSGGAVTISRDSVGSYEVRFAGLARHTGQRDNAQVTAYGSPAGTHCKMYEWGTDGADIVVPVHCHAPGASGPFVDSRFAVLVSGARTFDPSSPFAFAERLPQTQSLALDTSQTAFNSVTGHIGFSRSGTGLYNFAFPGAGHAGGPVGLLTSAVGQGPLRCRMLNYDVANAGLVAECTGPDGLDIDGRPSVMWFTRGRPGHRFAYASTQNMVSATPPADPTLSYSSSGGAITSRRLAAGDYTVVFSGLARPAGATEIVLVSALKELDHSCTISSWGNSGTSDLAVAVLCFDASGAPIDARFNILVVE